MRAKIQRRTQLCSVLPVESTACSCLTVLTCGSTVDLTNLMHFETVCPHMRTVIMLVMHARNASSQVCIRDQVFCCDLLSFCSRSHWPFTDTALKILYVPLTTHGMRPMATINNTYCWSRLLGACMPWQVSRIAKHACKMKMIPIVMPFM